LSLSLIVQTDSSTLIHVVGLLILLGGLAKCCKLPQWGPGKASTTSTFFSLPAHQSYVFVTFLVTLMQRFLVSWFWLTGGGPPWRRAWLQMIFVLKCPGLDKIESGLCGRSTRAVRGRAWGSQQAVASCTGQPVQCPAQVCQHACQHLRAECSR